MEIRKYQQGEENEIWNLFYNTVHQVNIKDYSVEQVNAWAPKDMDLETVYKKIKEIDPYVVLLDNQIVAYADLQENGYIDHFFCHHDYQGKGVGSKLIEKLIQVARQKRIKLLSADVSVTARPFFESKGFVVQEKQCVTRRGQGFTNFKMAQKI